jgi:hypothetical protein
MLDVPLREWGMGDQLRRNGQSIAKEWAINCEGMGDQLRRNGQSIAKQLT